MSQRKVMIIGLDAATLNLVKPWAAEGKLPNLARFMQQGAWGVLPTTIPILSPAAWSTFCTGTNPGKHGIIDFCQVDSDKYEARFINATHRRGATFWEVAGQQGVAGGIMNIPITYPPRAYNGFLVSCMISPGVSRGITTPPELFDDLMAVCPEYTIDVEMVNTGSDESRLTFLERAIETERARLKAAVGLYRKHRPPLFCVVFTSVDRVCHHYWAYMEAAKRAALPAGCDPKLGDAVLLAYQQLDEALGTLVQEADSDTDILVLSDHGAGPIHMGLSLRKLLAKAGLLVEKKPGVLGRLTQWGIRTFVQVAPTSVKNKIKAKFNKLTRQAASSVAFQGIDFTRTKAYANLNSGGIFVNLKGRQPNGIVEPGAEYEAVRSQIVELIRNLRDPETGQPVDIQVHRREEIWQGPCSAQLPDLILETGKRHFDVSVVEGIQGSDIFCPLPDLASGKFHRQGDHRREGMIMAMGPHIRPGELKDINIIDVPPTILAMLNCAIPEDFDGRVVTEMLTEDVSWPGRTSSVAPVADVVGSSEFSDEEQAVLEKRLKGLGYL